MEFWKMTEENKNLNASKQQERLFSDMSELVNDETIDSESFLKSLTELMDSEEYSDITNELAGVNEQEESIANADGNGSEPVISANSSVSSENANFEDGDLFENSNVEAGNLSENVNSEATDLSEDWNMNSYHDYYEDDFYDLDDDDEVAEVEWEELFPAKKVSKTKETGTVIASSKVLENAMSDEFPLELGEELSGVSFETEKSEEDETADDLSKEETLDNSDKEITADDSGEENVLTAVQKETDGENSSTPVSVEPDGNSEGEAAESEKELTPEELKAKKRSKIMWNLVSVACMLVMVYCIWRIANYFITGNQYKNEMKEVQDIVGNIAVQPIIIEPEVTEIYFPDEVIYVEDKGSVILNNEITDEWADTYKTLVELNPDCMGWIQIPDTNIDYPVMYTPNDYDKYLYLNFEEDYQFRGLPFLAEGTVLNKSQNYIMYGHYMKDGTAFQHLNKYLDRAWVEQHPYAYFYTAYDQGVYQVMDVVITKVFKEEDECFKYYNYSGELSEQDFNTYVYYMDKMSSINTGVDAVYGDKLISLSTCFRHYDEDGRLVVVFKRVQ